MARYLVGVMFLLLGVMLMAWDMYGFISLDHSSPLRCVASVAASLLSVALFWPTARLTH